MRALLDAGQVAARLAEAAASPEHQFWPDAISLLDRKTFDWSGLMGHRQVTDIYLLALAVRNQGRFVTFDQRITANVVPGATPEHLVQLQA